MLRRSLRLPERVSDAVPAPLTVADPDPVAETVPAVAVTVTENGEVLAGVDSGAAGLADAFKGCFDLAVDAPVFGFVEKCVAQMALHFGKQSLGFGELEISHPLQCSDLII